MAEEDTQLMQTRLDVAEMKGMLSQALMSHDSRLINLEDRVNIHERRLNDKKAILARHDERFIAVDERLNGVEQANTSRSGRITGIIGTVLGCVAGAIAVYNLLNPTGI